MENQSYGMQSVEDCDKVIAMFDDGHPLRVIAEGQKLIIAKLEESEKLKAIENEQIDILVDQLLEPQSEGSTRNIHIHYGEIEEEDTEAEQVEVEVIVKQAVLDSDNRIVSPAVKETRMVYPKVKVTKWVWSDKGKFPQPSGSSNNTNKTTSTKRGKTVYKHNPNGADEYLGNFKSCQAFCDLKGFVVGGDSPCRVLEREGYYTKPYDGTDFTS